MSPTTPQTTEPEHPADPTPTNRSALPLIDSRLPIVELTETRQNPQRARAQRRAHQVALGRRLSKLRGAPPSTPLSTPNEHSDVVRELRAFHYFGNSGVCFGVQLDPPVSQ